MVFLKDNYKATNDWDAQVNAAALGLDIARLLTEATDRLEAARNAVGVTKWHRHLEMMVGQLGGHNDGEGVHITNLVGPLPIALGFSNKDNPLHRRALLALSIMPSKGVKGGFLWADENNHNGNLRCMTHVYKKKGIKIIFFFRFIIKGESWAKFQQLAAVVRGKLFSETCDARALPLVGSRSESVWKEEAGEEWQVAGMLHVTAS